MKEDGGAKRPMGRPKKGEGKSGAKPGLSTGHKADMAQGHNGKPAGFSVWPPPTS